MKTSLLCTMVAGILIMSCDLIGDNPNQGRSSRDGRNSSERTDTISSSGEIGDKIPKSIYISAIEQSGDTCNVILLKDNKRILSLKTGLSYGIGSDPDQHHILGGHLFTEYTDSKGTVVQEDGKAFYYSDSQETIRGMIAVENDFYILSQNSSGNGFTLRKNAETMFHSETGRVWGDLLETASHPTGALYLDNETLCFSFYSSVLDTISGSDLKQWYLVKDGIQSKITLPNNITEIHDIKSINGDVCIVATKGSDNFPVLLVNGDSFNLQNNTIKTLKDFRLVKNENKPAFYGTIISGNSFKTGLWSKEGLEQSHAGRNDIVLEYNGFHSYINFSESGAITIDSPWSKSTTMNGPFHYITCRNVAINGLHIYIIANPTDKSQKPILWCDGETTELPGNLYLSSISVDY